MAKVKALNLQKRLLNHLVFFLDMPLTGSKARSRNRFIRLIAPMAQEVENERVKMLKDLSEKDEKGEPKVEKNQITGAEHYIVSTENRKKVDEYLDEDYVLDILPSNEKDVKVAKDLLLNSEMKLNIELGDIYDKLCTAFEEIK